MSDGFEVVRTGYDRIGHRYRDWSQDSPVRLRWVQQLLGQLEPGSLVVDLGCGAGEPATRMLGEQHRVVGVDGSLVQLRLAQAVVPDAALVQADIARLALSSANATGRTASALGSVSRRQSSRSGRARVGQAGVGRARVGQAGVGRAVCGRAGGGAAGQAGRGVWRRGQRFPSPRRSATSPTRTVGS